MSSPSSRDTQVNQGLHLAEGTDSSQGTPQLLSNISACLAISGTIASTLGPRGMDKLIVGANGEATISNDGATILKLLEVVHPAAKTLVDIARAQDAEVGDGTTSVVLLAGEFLRESKVFIEDGVSPHIIIKGYRRAAQLVSPSPPKHISIHLPSFCTGDSKGQGYRSHYRTYKRGVRHLLSTSTRAKLIQLRIGSDFRDLLLKCASTAMSSKLIHSQKPFFSNMVVNAVLTLDQIDLDESLIGMKKIPGGGMEDSILVKGVAFKKTFSYAGFEQQPKSFKDPKILCLSVELELKAERDNAEVRIEAVSVRLFVTSHWSGS